MRENTPYVFAATGTAAQSLSDTATDGRLSVIEWRSARYPPASGYNIIREYPRAHQVHLNPLVSWPSVLLAWPHSVRLARGPRSLLPRHCTAKAPAAAEPAVEVQLQRRRRSEMSESKEVAEDEMTDFKKKQVEPARAAMLVHPSDRPSRLARAAVAEGVRADSHAGRSSPSGLVRRSGWCRRTAHSTWPCRF